MYVILYEMIKFCKNTLKAFTMMEIIIGLAILSFIAIIGMVSLAALNNKQALQSEAEAVKQDMYVMQSRAVTGLRNQRFYIVTNSTYRLEEDTMGTGNWSTYQANRTFRPGIYFYGYVGKETKLEYKPSGLPDFNGAAASPFFSLIYNTTAEKKDFNIDSSGVVNIVTN
jgi:type II secretory pathway pseudopilin PulG